MALRFDANNDLIRRTTDLPNWNNPYTVAGWIYLVANRGTNSVLYGMDQGTVNYDIVVLMAGTQLGLERNLAGVSQSASGSTLTVGQWRHITMVRTSATQLLCYLDAVLDVTLNHTSVAARPAQTVFSLGGGLVNTLWSSVRLQYSKVWTRALSQAEIAVEMQYGNAIAPASTYGVYPHASDATRYNDVSGNGRTWTPVGTITDEAGLSPDLPWEPTGAEVVLGVPFLGELGAEFVPGLEEGIAPVGLSLPFLGEVGAEHAPALAVTEVALVVPFAGETGAEHVPAVAVTSQDLAVPFASQTGADFGPGLEAGIPSDVVAAPFLPEQGTEWAPTLLEGVPAGVLAVPFAGAAGVSFPPAVAPAEALEVPFSPATGGAFSPALAAGVVALQVPLAGAAGAAFAPGIVPGSMTLLIPFSPSSGAAFAPRISGDVEVLPVHLFYFLPPARAIAFAAPVRSFTF